MTTIMSLGLHSPALRMPFQHSDPASTQYLVRVAVCSRRKRNMQRVSASYGHDFLPSIDKRLIVDHTNTVKLPYSAWCMENSSELIKSREHVSKMMLTPVDRY